MRKPWVLVFVGRNGSGKSAVCLRVVEEMQKRGLTIYGPKEYWHYMAWEKRHHIWLHMVRGLLGGPRPWVLALQGVWAVLKVSPLAFEKYRDVIQLARKRYWLQSARRSGADVVVVDELIEYQINRLIRGRVFCDSERVCRILNTFYGGVTVLFALIDVPPHIAAKRRFERAGWLGKQPTQVAAWDADAGWQPIYEALKVRDPNGACEVDGTLSLEEEVRQIMTFLSAKNLAGSLANGPST